MTNRVSGTDAAEHLKRQEARREAKLGSIDPTYLTEKIESFRRKCECGKDITSQKGDSPRCPECEKDFVRQILWQHNVNATHSYRQELRQNIFDGVVEIIKAEAAKDPVMAAVKIVEYLDKYDFMRSPKK